MAKKKIIRATEAGKLKTVATKSSKKKGHSPKEARGAMYGSKE